MTDQHNQETPSNKFQPSDEEDILSLVQGAQDMRWRSKITEQNLCQIVEFAYILAFHEPYFENVDLFAYALVELLNENEYEFEVGIVTAEIIKDCLADLGLD